MEETGRSMIQSEGKASIISVDPVDYYKQYNENSAQDDINNFENQIVYYTFIDSGNVLCVTFVFDIK